MSKKSFGGNIVSKVSLDKTGITHFSTGEYEYFSCLIENGREVEINTLSSFTIAAVMQNPDTELSIPDLNRNIESGEIIQSENLSVTLKASGGQARLLIAGSVNSVCSDRKITFTKAQDVYKVVKPWGYELWLNKQHPDYAFKNIFIKKGTKTSLQFHRFKKETNLVYSGKTLLHYKHNDRVENEDAKPEDINTVLVESITAIDVSPSIVHRLEALTDILLYETSTPHLDDVIRIDDDTNRKNGKIISEHKA